MNDDPNCPKLFAIQVSTIATSSLQEFKSY